MGSTFLRQCIDERYKMSAAVGTKQEIIEIEDEDKETQALALPVDYSAFDDTEQYVEEETENNGTTDTVAAAPSIAPWLQHMDIRRMAGTGETPAIEKVDDSDAQEEEASCSTATRPTHK